MTEKDGAIVHYGDEALAKAIELLEGVGLPGGLLPMEDVIESGHVKETGYVWITQKAETKHMFKKAGKQVSYATEVKGYLEKNRMKNLTGVKAKEIFIWAPIADISIDPEKPGRIAFKAVGGLGKSFPVEAFGRGQ